MPARFDYLEASRSYDDPSQKDGCDVVTFVGRMGAAVEAR